MKCLYCGKEMTAEEPCYDYFPIVGGETMGQCEACLQSPNHRGNPMKNLCFLDLETTGLQIGSDRIISIGIMCGDGRTPFYELVNPERGIPAEVEELTGINTLDVLDAPTFPAIARRVAEYIKGRVLVGFNIHNFDLPVLAEEMCRAEVPFDWESFTVIDCGSIFKKKEERTLTAAVQFYCGVSFDGAHDALQDAIATSQVYKGQLAAYPDLAAMTAQQLAEFSLSGDKRADPAGKLIVKDGQIVYNFGKHKGMPILDEVGFGYWMLEKDFPETTKRVLRKAFGLEGAQAGRVLIGH